MKTILVVDDNQSLRDALTDYLGRAEFHVLTASDGEQMWAHYQTHAPDLIILDIMLPGDDGLTLCSQIRKHSNVPIIMLTAVTDEADRVAGLEVGADDYMTKTFSPRELLARIKALLRRTRMTQSSGVGHKVTFAGWTCDLLKRQLVSPHGECKQLSGADFNLISLMLEKPNQLLSRDDIARCIWGRDAEPFERGIDVQISRLRKHLHDDERSLILTVRNKGYMLATDVIATEVH
ncbi:MULTISPECIES: response regulator transcription factor [unclassified Salinivibrio]|uniref:response regulator transcription factor n=1 Tax=unclassified Salinivibrio TaxID=2636825 RepID=UPI000986151A|nr:MULTISPECIES: response regulator transcription factor [unclassified Salinivibrio]OOE75892.1 DNA-binding response regulator [Salinivibrio sp. ML290]OOF14226.1 DNA-binding response regulator [Salinivibrio sp. PR919]OOF18106.1 DNA-binding response regulator [Salinivibrio sp. PR932]